MPSNEACEIGFSGNSVSCSKTIDTYESFYLKCSIQTCKKKNKHEHQLCVNCGKLFDERKRQLILR
jgi:hypothetical protein